MTSTNSQVAAAETCRRWDATVPQTLRVKVSRDTGWQLVRWTLTRECSVGLTEPPRFSIQHRSGDCGGLGYEARRRKHSRQSCNG
jgi:hypothetical protein